MTRHWTEDKDQCEEFFNLVGSTIDREARYHATRYGVPRYGDDIAAEARLKLWEQMMLQSPTSPFDLDTPKESADLAVERYFIRESVRSAARTKARRESRQAQLLQDVEQPEMPEDTEMQLMAIAQKFPSFERDLPDLTVRDREILRLEVCRRVGMDDLPEVLFDEAARTVGVDPATLRAHIHDFDRSKSLDDRDRKAWSRVTKKIRRGGLCLLLLLSLPVASSSLTEVQPGKQIASLHQGPGGDVTVASHQGPGKDVTVALHQGPGKDVAVALHQEPGRNLTIALHQDPGKWAESLCKQGTGLIARPLLS